jgi:hypothetical protein
MLNNIYLLDVILLYEHLLKKLKSFIYSIRNFL